MSKIEKWAKHEFESSSLVTPDFAKFVSDFKKEFKKDLEGSCLSVGRIIVGHFEISGFVVNNNTGKIAYFSVGDVRWGNWYYKILVREAATTSDYRGGLNNFVSYHDLVVFLYNLTQ